jgi:hypothetical protein
MSLKPQGAGVFFCYFCLCECECITFVILCFFFYFFFSIALLPLIVPHPSGIKRIVRRVQQSVSLSLSLPS